MNILTRFKKLFRFVWRDAGTGRFVSREYAEKNKGTTTRERVK